MATRAASDTDDCVAYYTACVDTLVEDAKTAQLTVKDSSQHVVDQLIRAMVWACVQPGIPEKIASCSVNETQMGNLEDKIEKVVTKCRAALFDIICDKSVGVIEEDHERGIVKIAKPVGVIGVTCPSTSPESTALIKSINAIKGRNAIILSPHPKAQQTTELVVRIMRHALVHMDANPDLVQIMRMPNRKKTEYLLSKCDLSLVTGGQNIVKIARFSGKPYLTSGVGNVVTTVDDTANISLAVRSISRSKTFDFGSSCSSDNSVLAFHQVYDKLLEGLVREGGFVLSPADSAKIKNVLWQPNGNLNPGAVATSAQNLCSLAGVELPSDSKFLITEQGVGNIGPEYLFSGEKLSPVLALFKVINIEEAIRKTNDIHKYQGIGHSCGIYSSCEANISALSLQTHTSRVMVNQPQSLSNSGSLWNEMTQSMSLGCGTWGVSNTNDNINWKNLVNITTVSKPLVVPKKLPPDEILFAGVQGQLTLSLV
mmetsp:Transcript_23284/g.37101  ORF Transcript_23284/g.37101 Transcript_23284/m.37101 type:complete len:484 (+) Transcript_23284:2775-4226(+)|eukprot:CAMPEP_0203755656 /NCGR_PEP_ID=MMETSP0098-20131031/9067_1 /ASSEMBLY_ACC=CAM_ASM_000208 /TAXON_ID=96639 /ORGANISM=" , Strain NY0313808BC1" /LENGTH=483 /DNA_ID=CAMNT_0050647213 /DNA_START=2709 /DNA_END=4160 /DNA_ORIENTATION=-